MGGEYGVIICGAFLQRGAEDLQIARVIRQVIGEKLHIADPVVAAAFQHGLQQRFGQLGRQIIIPGFEVLGKGSLIPQRGFQLILKRAVGVGPRRRQSRTVCIAVFVVVDLLREEDRPRQTEQQPAEDQPHKGKIDHFLQNIVSLPAWDIACRDFAKSSACQKPFRTVSPLKLSAGQVFDSLNHIIKGKCLQGRIRAARRNRQKALAFWGKTRYNGTITLHGRETLEAEKDDR